MIEKRVVITGMGVLAPNAHGLEAFETALRQGQSGIRYLDLLKELNFTCQVVGIPQNVDTLTQKYFSPESLLAMNSSMIYGSIAAIDCWIDSGFQLPSYDSQFVDWDTGVSMGTAASGMDTIGERLVPLTNQGKVKRLGSTLVEQYMMSSSSANIAGLLGLGGQVTTNSSACSTGTEALINAFFNIKQGRLKRILAGGTEGASQYSWAGFDAMKVLAQGFNSKPELASRPMSASAAGFVPSSGAGMLMLEDLTSAQERSARIYAEIIGVHVNCGGQRNGGSISAPNPLGIQRCIQKAIEMANISSSEIDLINGHLTATIADPAEINNWHQALGRKPSNFPLINSTKSLIGHALGAAGAIEAVSSVLQLYKGFVHGSINCEDLHPKIEPFANSIVHSTKNIESNILAKASFGFGDVNACVIFKRWKN